MTVLIGPEDDGRVERGKEDGSNGREEMVGVEEGLLIWSRRKKEGGRRVRTCSERCLRNERLTC